MTLEFTPVFEEKAKLILTSLSGCRLDVWLWASATLKDSVSEVLAEDFVEEMRDLWRGLEVEGETSSKRLLRECC